MIVRSYFEKRLHENGARFRRKINRKISTQFKLLEFDEKETELLIKRNKKSDTEKYLQHVELKLDKLQEFNYSAQVVLLDKG